MKNLKLLTLLVLLPIFSYSQIEEFKGIYGLDSCKFETISCSLIQIDTSSQNIWEIGLPAKPFFDTAFSPPHAILTDSINPYASSNHSFFDLRFEDYGVSNLILGFKHKFQTDSLIDGGYLEISYDNGQNWVNVMEDDRISGMPYFGTENMYTLEDTLQGGIKGFSGTSDGWIYTQIQWVWELPVLMAFASESPIIRFNFISDPNQTFKDGWMIDDIVLSFADLGSAVKEIIPPIKAKISPNPLETYSIIELKNLEKGDYNLQLFDSQGRLQRRISNVTDQPIRIEKENLASGLYFIQLHSRGQVQMVGKLFVE